MWIGNGSGYPQFKWTQFQMQGSCLVSKGLHVWCPPLSEASHAFRIPTIGKHVFLSGDGSKMIKSIQQLSHNIFGRDEDPVQLLWSKDSEAEASTMACGSWKTLTGPIASWSAGGDQTFCRDPARREARGSHCDLVYDKGVDPCLWLPTWKMVLCLFHPILSHNIYSGSIFYMFVSFCFFFYI